MKLLPPLRRAAALLGVALLVVPGCPRDRSDEPDRRIIDFDTARLRVASGSDTAELHVELAITGDQKAVGLMERRSLAEDAGMLFLYPEVQPASASFWMYRTRIPLDIAFIDSLGVIRSIRAMDPCEAVVAQACPTYPSGVPFRAALEVNRGWFTRRELGVGDRVLLDPGTPGDAGRTR